MSNIELLLKAKMAEEANKAANQSNDGQNDVTFENADFEVHAKAVAAALNPVIKQLEDLLASVEKMHATLPGAFTSVGAGLGAAGPAGASAYASATSDVSRKITRAKAELKKLKS